MEPIQFNQSLTYSINIFSTETVINIFLNHLNELTLKDIILLEYGYLFRMKDINNSSMLFKLDYKTFTLTCRKDGFYLIEKKLSFNQYKMIKEKIINFEIGLIDNLI